MIAAPAAVVAAAIPATSVWTDMFTLEIPPIEKVLRTVLVYVAIVLVLRIAGKRLLAQMNALDLVVVLLISNVVQNAIIGADNSVVGGVLGVIVLIVVNDLFDRLAQRFAWARWLLEGRSTILISDGVIDEPAVRRLGLTDHDVMEALHSQGADKPAEVRSAVISPGGRINVAIHRDDQPASYGELRAAIEDLKRHIDTKGA